MKEVIIGIDPGMRITGYGIITFEGALSPIDHGCIRPPRNASPEEKRRIIFESLTHLLENYRPSALAVETQYVDKNISSAMKLGMTRGVILLAASLQGIPTFEYAPSSAKRAVVGSGKASKVQVQKMVQHLLKLKEEPQPEDAADALALAITHALRQRIQYDV